MRTIQDSDAVAYHEAAHATIEARLGILRNDAIITIGSGSKGEYGSVSFSKRPCERWSARYKRKFILSLYAGPAASKKLVPGVNLFEEGGECESDMVLAQHLMQSCAPGSWESIHDPVFQSYRERKWRRAVALVNLNWCAIKAVAEELLKRQTMTGLEVKAKLAASR